MKERIFIVEGALGSGRKTFIGNITKRLIHTTTIDYDMLLKTPAEKMGWRNIPNNAENYKFLAQIHELWTSFNDKLLLNVISTIEEWSENKDRLIFVIPKFQSDIDKLIISLPKYQIIRLFVYRKEVSNEFNILTDLNSDIIINNNGTLNDLVREADMFIGKYAKSFIRLDTRPVVKGDVKIKKSKKSNRKDNNT